MTRAQDDKTFGFGKTTKTIKDDVLITVRKNVYFPNPVLGMEKVYDKENKVDIWTDLTLDEAEALAYRLLYAVKRIKEDTDGAT